VSAPRTGRDAHGAHSHQPLSGPERRLAPVMWSMTRGHALGGWREPVVAHPDATAGVNGDGATVEKSSAVCSRAGPSP